MKSKIIEHPHPVGGYVVMRHSKNAKRMHCCMVHDEYKPAHEEAQRLFAQSVADGNDPSLTGYYVLRLVDRVGVFDGVLAAGGTQC